jgi:hypothetical protein
MFGDGFRYASGGRARVTGRGVGYGGGLVLVVAFCASADGALVIPHGDTTGITRTALKYVSASFFTLKTIKKCSVN